MKRYRVRPGAKKYTDPGPDLLRPASSTVQTFASAMGDSRTGWYHRRDPAGSQNWGRWIGPIVRRDLLVVVDRFVDNGRYTAKLQAARVREGKMNVKAECQIVNVPEVNLPGVKEGAEMVADLARVFGATVPVGYSCREYNGIPGSGWSDHAHGDAVDLDYKNGKSPGLNDVLTDWLVRMGRAGCLGNCAQIIGSSNGRVYNFNATAYRANLGGPESHKTHVHVSYVQHYGSDPNCR